MLGLQLNEYVAEPGDVVFRHACKLGFEGIVSKRLGSRYRSGRSRDWLKFKNRCDMRGSGLLLRKMMLWSLFRGSQFPDLIDEITRRD
jgi:ATP-dependent DNA ligase